MPDCPKCGKSYSSNSVLNRHLRNCNPPTDKEPPPSPIPANWIDPPAPVSHLVDPPKTAQLTKRCEVWYSDIPPMSQAFFDGYTEGYGNTMATVIVDQRGSGRKRFIVPVNQLSIVVRE